MCMYFTYFINDVIYCWIVVTIATTKIEQTVNKSINKINKPRPLIDHTHFVINIANDNETTSPWPHPLADSSSSFSKRQFTISTVYSTGNGITPRACHADTL